MRRLELISGKQDLNYVLLCLLFFKLMVYLNTQLVGNLKGHLKNLNLHKVYACIHDHKRFTKVQIYVSSKIIKIMHAIIKTVYNIKKRIIKMFNNYPMF